MGDRLLLVRLERVPRVLESLRRLIDAPEVGHDGASRWCADGIQTVPAWADIEGMSEKTFRPWVVDHHQVIVAMSVGNAQNDHDEFVPLVDQIKAHTGQYPAEVSADTGYCSEANLERLEDRGINAYIATGRQTHGMSSPTSNEAARSGPRSIAMRTKFRRGGWRSRYRLR